MSSSSSSEGFAAGLYGGRLARLDGRLSPRQQRLVANLLLTAGVLSIAIPLTTEVVRFLIRLRGGRRDRDKSGRKPQVFKVVLTGGPCSGKTSSLEHLKKSLNEAGYQCLTVPEVPTILIEGGAAYPGVDGGRRLIQFEVALLRLQLQMEESFLQIARSLDAPTVVISDRGALDIAAYLMPKDWLQTLQAVGLTNVDLLHRYDAVVHLVTAADGAQSYYTLANNAARTESAKDARVLDRRIKASWAAHPRLIVVDNSTDFAGKLDRCDQAILAAAKRFFAAGSTPAAPAATAGSSNGGSSNGGGGGNGAPIKP